MVKKLLGAVAAMLAVVIGLVMFVVVLLGGDEEQSALSCGPIAGQSGGTGGAVDTPVLPAGAKVRPAASSATQLSSGYRSPDRPDHRGQDWAGPAGTPIYAYTDGVVAEAGPASGFGNWIVINHTAGGQMFSTVYGHMYDDGVLVKSGQQVRAGQMIGKIGSNGQSTGPHLHFEVWPGGRLSGGKDTDPMPYLQGAVEPGSPAAAQQAEASAVGQQPPAGEPSPVAAQSGSSAGGAGAGEIPALPAAKGSEEHMTVDSVRIMRSIAMKFPQVEKIGGWRPSDPYPDHPSGRAVDIMIPNYSSPEGQSLGSQINAYVQAHAAEFNVQYTIWRQEYMPVGGAKETMDDRGGDTANHMDHVHVTVKGDGHGLATPGQKIDGQVPEGGAVTAAQIPGCGSQFGGNGDGNGGNVANVPPEFLPWLKRAGSLCKQVSAPLLAAQLGQENAFQWGPDSPVSEKGAMGPAQFMPGTWAAVGKDFDGDGKVDVNSIGDAIMSQGTYMCEIAGQIDAAIAAGKVRPGPEGVEGLYLAGYNGGPGSVLDAGGMPSGGDFDIQTRPYVTNILANKPKYEAKV